MTGSRNVEDHDLGLPTEFNTGLERLTTAAGSEGPLPDAVVHLGLAIAFANKGDRVSAEHHGRRSLAAGLTRPQAIEGLLAGVLSRGTGVFWNNLWIAEEAPVDTWPERASSDSESTTEDILEYFRGNFGEVPTWLRYLADFSPETLKAYYDLRSLILTDAALPRRHKESILVLINSAERYEVGMRVHMQGALAAGGSRSELLHAVRASILAGGMVAWLEAADVLQSVTDEHEP